MRSWWWKASDMNGDFLQLRIEFEDELPASAHLKGLVRATQLPGLVRAAPEVVATFDWEKENADYYFNERAYARLPFFTGRNSFGSFHQMIVTDTVLRIEIYGGTAKYDRMRHKPGATTLLIAFLIYERRLRVRHWKVTVSYLEDGGNYPPNYVTEGDHEALIEYLELDKPEQRIPED